MRHRRPKKIDERSRGLDISLHKKQGDVFRSRAHVRALVAGRGFGKSVLMLMDSIKFCLDYREPINPVSPQVAMICMPTLKMAKQIYWKPLMSLLEFSPAVENVNKSDYRITFKGPLPDLLLRGADRQGERLRGLNLCFAGLDEYQGFEPMIWDEVLDAALSRNRHWRALVIGTPQGKLNHFYSFYQRAIANEDWRSWHFKTAENPYFPKRHLIRAKRELPGRTYRQEFEASFEEFEGQICSEAVRSRHLVACKKYANAQYYIGLDPGTINPALCLFSVSEQPTLMGVSKHVFTVYDSWYEPTGEAYTTDELVNQARILAARSGMPIKRIFIPDDRADLVKTFRQAGYGQAVLVKRNDPGPKQRAEIINTLFKCDRLFFEEGQSEFFDEILSYRRETGKDGRPTEEIARGQTDHRCLVEGTMIETDRGCVAVEDVSVGDSVLTRKGYRKVLASGVTGINRDVFEVSTASGKVFTATGNHRVFTTNGFVSVDALMYNDEILEIETPSECRKPKSKSVPLSIAAKSTADTPRQNVRAIADITELLTGTMVTTVGSLTYTGASGSRPTNALFQKALLSIIRIMILGIMPQRTLSLCPKKSTPSCISLSGTRRATIKLNSSSTLRLSGLSLLRGIHQRKAKNYMRSLLKTSALIIGSRLRGLAKTALRFFSVIISARTGRRFAQTDVMQQSEGRAELITKKGHASIAPKLSASISTNQQSIVAGRVLRVLEAGKAAKVYDLTVEGEHEYFANGVLMHNCDALFYGCSKLTMDYPALLPVPDRIMPKLAELFAA